MKKSRAKRIYVVVNKDDNGPRIITDTMAEVMKLRFSSPSRVVSVATLREVLKPFYTVVAGYLSKSLGVEVRPERLVRGNVEQSMATGELAVSVEFRDGEVSQVYNISLVPALMPWNFIDRIALSSSPNIVDPEMRAQVANTI